MSHIVKVQLTEYSQGVYGVDEITTPENARMYGFQVAHKTHDVWYKNADIFRHAWHPLEPELVAQYEALEVLK